MKALDTNILVRFLLRDDEGQAETVYRLFRQAESEKALFFVPLLVILETIWVLEAVYQISRTDILDAINDILYLPILKFEAQPALKRFMAEAKEKNADLSDILFACSARLAGSEAVLSFDKKAAKAGVFELLQSRPARPS
jgi:predicted nucleic-acid-binding protein